MRWFQTAANMGTPGPADFLHHLVEDEEFDALSVELLRPESAAPTPQHVTTPTVSESEAAAAADNTIFYSPLDNAWLNADLGKHPAREHARKVAKELGVRTGIIYLPGQVEKPYEDSDMNFEFRQRRHFYYLSGVDVPGCAVTYDIASDFLVLWAPESDPRTILWEGRKPNAAQYHAASQLSAVVNIEGLKPVLSDVLSKKPGTTLYVLRPDQVPQLDLEDGTVCLDTTQLRPAIENARVIKTDHEVALIRRANAISSGAHKAVQTYLKRCRTEADISVIYHSYCLAHGANRQAYPAIVASGTNASTLHYTDNNQPLAGRELVVLDAGAEWKCYASDVTRTLPISGDFSNAALDIYSIVSRMQQECIDRVRPGVTFRSLHVHAARVAVVELLELGVLHKGSTDEIMEKGTIAAFFPHGLGHHVGLEVHDVSGRGRLLLAAAPPVAQGGRAPLKRDRLTAQQAAALYREALELARGGTTSLAQTSPGGGRQKLEKNMVVTIEPGIYFCREYIDAFFRSDPVHSRYINWDVLERYWDVGGVRIEDDILVTESGYENLTWAPKLA